MKLCIRQRVFSWTDSYDVYDEWGNPRYEVRTEFFPLAHLLHIYERSTGREVGFIREGLMTLMPKFSIIMDGQEIGTVRREFTLFLPRYQVDYRNWDVTGDLMGWDYQIVERGHTVGTISKQVFSWSDTYTLDFADPADELPGLLLVLAIDAANCHSSNEIGSIRARLKFSIFLSDSQKLWK